MISARLGHSLDKQLSPVAKRLTVSPNTLTILGFMITTVAAVTLAKYPLYGGILIAAGGLMDMLDGAVARSNGKATRFGAFLDSVLDRFSDAFIFLGFAWYLRDNAAGVFLSIGSMLGAFGVSYARARAEGLGKDCKTGLMERSERIVLLIFAALTGWMLPVLWALFVLTFVTVIQRIYHVWKLENKG